MSTMSQSTGLPAGASLDRVFAHDVLGIENGLGRLPEFSRDLNQLQPYLDAIENQSAKRIVSERVSHGWKTQIFEVGEEAPIASAHANERPLSIVRALLFATQGIPVDIGELDLPSVPGF